MANVFTTYTPTDNGVTISIDLQNEKFIEKNNIAEAFETYGGGFAEALGIALYRADKNNTKKILETWDGMVKEYILTFKIN